MAGAWRQELLIVVPIGLAGFLFSAWTERSTGSLLFLVTLYLGWHLLQIYRLNVWLTKPKSASLPLPYGIWNAITRSVVQRQEQARKRKRKLDRTVDGFRESSNALPDATVILDGKGFVQWWNDIATTLLRLDPKRDCGRRIAELMPDSILTAYLLEGEYKRPLKMKAPHNDNIVLEVRIVPYGKGNHLLQARDITRLQHLEIVRRDFVTNVSHEMRTPLTVIHGYLETIAERPEEAPAGNWQRVVLQMIQQTDRMQCIIKDLLMLSRLESEEQTLGQAVVDVAALLESVSAEISLLSKGRHRIHLRADADLKLYGIENELESAFYNLADNAVRYTSAGGSIAMYWYENGGKACFTIKDTGIGITPEHIPRLTERFYRVDVARSRQSGGTGLGLAIVKHVLTRHGSVLDIQSEPGRGSLFSCTFPEYRVSRKINEAINDPIHEPKHQALIH